jgi:uncharacterized protein YbjT (DUF2867 family)
VTDEVRRVFVTGATGYTGREVVRVARSRDLETHAHVRPDSPQLARWQTRFRAVGAEVDTTPWHQEALTSRLAETRPDVVFALLGTTRARARAVRKRGGDPTAASYEAVDYGLTAMLLRATREACPRARFVYLSAMGVKPDPEGGSSYVGVRARLEAELRASGQPHVIARPGFISGSDREETRPMERAAARTSDALLGVVGALGATRLRDRLQSLSGRELAEALISLALDPACEGSIAGPAELRARLSLK